MEFTPAQKAAHKAWATRRANTSEEERRAMSREAGRKAAATKRRSAAARKANEIRGTEGRRAAALKAAETKRATGTTPAHSIRVPDQLWHWALAEAERQDTTVTAVVIKALEKFIGSGDE
jgi:hypothetical protein